MTTYTLSIIVEGKDHASGPLGGISSALSKIGQIAGGILVASGLSNIASGLMNIGKSAIGATANMQAMQVGIESLVARELRATNSQLSLNQALAQAQPIAQGLMKDLKEIAVLSPYQMNTVWDTFRMGMAFGFTAEESKKMTSGLLNVAAGVGASDEMLGRMAYNLAQVRLQGKVTAVDVRQLAMAGFDLTGALKHIGAQFGLTINSHEDFNKALAEGKIKWEDFAGAFEKYADENFGGAAKRMSMTLNGLKSTFADVFELTFPTILGPAAEKVTAFLQDMLGKFMAFSESGVLEEWGKSLGDSVGRGIDKLYYLAAVWKRFTSFGAWTLKPVILDNLFSLQPGTFQKLGKQIISGLQGAIGVAATGAGMAGLGVPLGIGISAAFGKAIGLVAFGPLVGKLLNGLFTAVLLGLSRFSPMLGGAFFRMFMVGGVAGKLGLAFAGIAKFLGPLLPMFGGLAAFVGLALIALTAFGVVVQALSGNIGFFQGLLAQVGSALLNFAMFWQQQGPTILEIGQQVFGALIEAGVTLANAVLPFLASQLEVIGVWFVANGPLISQFIQVLADGFTNFVIPAVVGAWAVIEPILAGLLQLLLGLATTIMQVAVGDWAGAWVTMQITTQTVGASLMTAITAFLNWIASWFGSSLAEIGAVWSENWVLFQQIVSTVTMMILSLITDWLSTAVSVISGAAGAMSGAGTALMNGLLNSVQAIGGKIVKFVGDLVANIIAAVKAAMSALGDLASIKVPSPGGGGGGGGGGGLTPHASGGSVMAGQGYFVGENGPEPFFPGVSGYMLATRKARSLFADAAGGAGGGSVQNIVVNVNGAGNPDAVADAVVRKLKLNRART